MKEIAAAFVKAQKGFLPATKNTENPFFKSRYADLASCIEAVISSLNDNGIALVQHTSDSDKGVIVHTTFLHESGEIMETGSIFFPAVTNTPQAFGSALTYARRYSLMTACGIAPEDDDGHVASKPTVQTTTVSNDSWPTDEPTNEDPWGNSDNATPAETCQHGNRVWKEGDKEGKAWGGWSCPHTERGNQCAMIWYKLSSDGTWKPQVKK